MRAIGIDLGTTNSAAAAANGDAKVLPTRAGEQLTPSVVSYLHRRKAETGQIVAGRQAANNAARRPEDTVHSIKRLMGALYGDEKLNDVVARASFSLADPPEGEDADHTVRVLINGEPFTPVQISAKILEQIKSDAELALGERVTHAVITVPAYFEERQRQATAEAGKLAGLGVLKIVDEPTAAAIAFGAGKEDERNRVLVYDLGGGTFDISIIQMVAGKYAVLNIEGDNWLGGDDFDHVIVDRMVEWVKEEYDYDATADRAFLAKARIEAEKAKKALSGADSAEIIAPLFHRAGERMIDLDMEVTREEFETDIAAMVDRTIELVQKAMSEQSLGPDDFTEVLLVGGSTAVPLVQEAITEVFPGKVKRNVNPMECVAIGAAILAAKYDLSEEEVSAGDAEGSLHEITAMHLGIEVVKDGNDDCFFPIIPKGTPFPLAKPFTHAFFPTEHEQTLIRVPVYEGLSERASLNEQQGVIEFPLPKGVDQGTRIEVQFNYDRNRVLTVGVQVVGTDQSIEETLNRGRRRVRKKEESLLEDWREELQPAINTGRHFLEQYGAYMTDDDKLELQEAMQQGEKAMADNDEASGTQAAKIIHNKIFGSPVASLLFLAEHAINDAPAKDAKELAQLVAALREAHARGNAIEIEKVSMAIRITLPRVLEGKEKRQAIGGRKDYKGLLST